MAKSRAKVAAVAVPVPQSFDEARAFIGAIGDLQRARDALQTEMNAELEKLRRYYEERASKKAEAIGRYTEGLRTWAAAHRDELTQGGKTKTAVLATGELRWRMTPPAVTLRDGKKVLAALLKEGLSRFIRTALAVDKEAILKEQDAVKDIAGITITQHEEFVVVPNETKLEEVA